VYRELDAELSREAVRCRRCGRCCDFRRNDYVLFASQIERELIGRWSDEPAVLRSDGTCPWLREGLCTIHPVRPLGCRTAFCDPSWRPRQAEVYERCRARLVDICRRHRLPWDYRPLLRVSPDA
jgi:Fe-S-cluster containining protein